MEDWAYDTAKDRIAEDLAGYEDERCRMEQELWDKYPVEDELDLIED